MLSDILKALRKPTTRSSADLRQDLERIDLAALESEVDGCEARRRTLLLTGSDDQIEAATRDLAAANLAAERAEAAVAELTRQIAEATERERLASVEKQASEAKAARVAVIEAYAALHNATLVVTRLLTVIRAGEATIREANGITSAAGRRDLKVPWPRAELLAHLGLTDGQLPDPLLWRIEGYWPDRAVFNGTAQMSAPLRADRRFDRAVELLYSQPRKAAA